MHSGMGRAASSATTASLSIAMHAVMDPVGSKQLDRILHALRPARFACTNCSLQPRRPGLAKSFGKTRPPCAGRRLVAVNGKGHYAWQAPFDQLLDKFDFFVRRPGAQQADTKANRAKAVLFGRRESVTERFD